MLIYFIKNQSCFPSICLSVTKQNFVKIVWPIWAKVCGCLTITHVCASWKYLTIFSPHCCFNNFFMNKKKLLEHDYVDLCSLSPTRVLVMSGEKTWGTVEVSVHPGGVMLHHIKISRQLCASNLFGNCLVNCVVVRCPHTFDHMKIWDIKCGYLMILALIMSFTVPTREQPPGGEWLLHVSWSLRIEIFPVARPVHFWTSLSK